MKIAVQPNTSLNNKTGHWRTFKPKTDYNKCISCATCSRVCPEGIIVMNKINGYEKQKPITDLNYCKGCGICAAECPVKAITMELEQK